MAKMVAKIFKRAGTLNRHLRVPKRILPQNQKWPHFKLWFFFKACYCWGQNLSSFLFLTWILHNPHCNKGYKSLDIATILVPVNKQTYIFDRISFILQGCWLHTRYHGKQSLWKCTLFGKAPMTIILQFILLSYKYYPPSSIFFIYYWSREGWHNKAWPS